MNAGITRLLSDTLIYGLSRYLSALAGLLLVPLYTRMLPPAEYGAVDLLNTMSVTLAVFAILGGDSALALYYYEAKTPEDRIATASTGFALRAVLALGVMALAIAAAPAINDALFHGTRYANLLLVVLLAFPFQVLLGFCLDYLRLRLEPIRYMVLNVGSVLLSTGLGITLVVVLDMGAKGLVLATTSATVITAFAALWMVRSGLGRVFSREMSRNLLKFGLPLVPASFATWLITYSDRYFISHFLSLSQIGVYAVGLKIASVMALATSSFQLAWGPFAFSIKDEPDARQTYARILTYYVAVAMGLALVLGSFGAEILYVLAARSYSSAGPVISLLVLVPVLIGAYYIFSVGVNLMAKTALISFTTGLAALVSVSLNALLIPRFGIMGAGLSAVASNIVSAMALLVLAQRIYPIPFEKFRVGTLWFLGVGGLAFSAGLGPESTVFKAIPLGVYVLALVGLGIVGPTEWNALKRLIAGPQA